MHSFAHMQRDMSRTEMQIPPPHKAGHAENGCAIEDEWLRQCQPIHNICRRHRRRLFHQDNHGDGYR